MELVTVIGSAKDTDVSPMATAPSGSRQQRLSRAGLLSHAASFFSHQHGDFRNDAGRSAAQRVDSVVTPTGALPVGSWAVFWLAFSAARQPCVLRSSRRPRVDRRARAVAGRNADSRLTTSPFVARFVPSALAAHALTRTLTGSHAAGAVSGIARLQSLSRRTPSRTSNCKPPLPAPGIACASSRCGDVAPAMAGGVLVRAPVWWPVAAITCSH